MVKRTNLLDGTIIQVATRDGLIAAVGVDQLRLEAF